MNNNESISDKQALNFILYGQIAGGILSNSNLHFATAEVAAEFIYDRYSAIVAKFHKGHNKPVEKKKKHNTLKHEQQPQQPQ